MADLPMSTGLLWLVIVAMGVGTYVLRVSFIVLFGRFETVPPRVENALRFVPPAVLAALVVPGLVSLDGSFAVQFDPAQLLAGVLAGVVAWRTESMLATIGVGMGALWLLGLVLH